jgi:hypothetical protein
VVISEPWRVLTNVGAEDFVDGGRVGRGVLGNPFQRVDTTGPYHDLLATKLIDRLGEPLSDVPLLSDRQLIVRRLELRRGRLQVVLETFPVDLQLPPGDVAAEDQNQPAHSLQQHTPSIVLCADGIAGVGEGVPRRQVVGQNEDRHSQEGQPHTDDRQADQRTASEAKPGKAVQQLRHLPILAAGAAYEPNTRSSAGTDTQHAQDRGLAGLCTFARTCLRTSARTPTGLAKTPLRRCGGGR